MSDIDEQRYAADARRRAITSGDVARAAGVSQSAVSLVLSGKASNRVSAATAERIRAAATALGYSPNHAAVMLRTGTAPTLALAVPTVTQPFFSAMLRGAEARAREFEYSMILLDSGSDDLWMTRLAGMLRGGLLAGAIAYAPTEAEAAILADTGLSVVLADVEYQGFPSIRFDFSAGAREAADHLIGLGHRQIAYLAAGSERETYRQRCEIFAARVRESGGNISAVAHSASLGFDDAVVAATELLRSNPEITAVMCDDDLLAAAVVRAAGPLRVPAALSVIGVGNIELSRMLTPELTTVDISSSSIGAQGVDLLLARRDSDGLVPRRLLSSSLIVRGSTGPVPPNF